MSFASFETHSELSLNRQKVCGWYKITLCVVTDMSLKIKAAWCLIVAAQRADLLILLGMKGSFPSFLWWRISGRVMLVLWRNWSLISEYLVHLVRKLSLFFSPPSPVAEAEWFWQVLVLSLKTHSSHSVTCSSALNLTCNIFYCCSITFYGK